MSRRTAIGTFARDNERALLETLRPARDALVKASGKMATRSGRDTVDRASDDPA